MILKLLLLASVALGAGATKYTHFDCGTGLNNATKEFMSTLHELHGNSKTSSPAALAARAASSPITIDTVFHMVATSDNKDSISASMPQGQLAALNAAYAASNISFNLLNVTWTINDAWAVGAGADDAAMKAALRQGSYATLNLYFQTDLAGGILGVCSLPASIGAGTPAPRLYASDGCNIQAGTMPGGGIGGYDQGMTAVHETGHWLGLLHTFEGYACAGSGDFIDDTPLQSTSTDGCPVGPPAKDSCPQQPGVDLIHNIMDYSIDECYTGFTDGQAARMYSMWAMYRQGK